MPVRYAQQINHARHNLIKIDMRAWLLPLVLALSAALVVDQSSYANLDEVVTHHVHLALRVDFSNKTISGQAQLKMQAIKSSVKKVVLDYQGLVVKSVVKVSAQGQVPLSFSEDQPYDALGHRLTLELDQPAQKGESFNLVIDYFTLHDSSQKSINWLEPSQTAGKVLPYLFTQCESINCRSLAPLQDSPSNKITYSADITVPSQFKVQMSAVQQSSSQKDGLTTYSFTQLIKIPSYLIALAVGDLEYRKIGKRTGVITEPSFMEQSAECLQDLDSYLDKAEEIFGEYVWGNYTVLVLPPSFPFGGMENPLMTFASPTVITKDRQQVFVAIHEIMHSWFGNTITMKTWKDFWLNEGFTVFAERTISGLIFGEDFKKVQSQIGLADVKADMTVFGFNSTYSSLQPQLKHHNPDDSFSTVPYEKGYFFLTYLASLISHDQMIAFLRLYIQRFKYTSIDTATFKAFFEDYCERHLLDISAVDWSLWLTVGGMPTIVPALDTPIYEKAMQLANDYLARKEHIDTSVYGSFFSAVKVLFVEHFLANLENMDSRVSARLDQDLLISQLDDPEVKCAWYQLSLKTGYTSSTLPLIRTFLSVQGRLKYLSPIYRACMDSKDPVLIQFAKDTYQANLHFYHPLAVDQIGKIVNGNTQYYQ